MKPRFTKFRIALLLLAVAVVGFRQASPLLPSSVREWLTEHLPFLLTPSAVVDKKVANTVPQSCDSASAWAQKQAALAQLEPDPSALPVGITSIDGEGGSGFDRMVRTHGNWFPVYDQRHLAAGGPSILNVVSLRIISGSLPGISVDEPLQYQAEAIGGQTPYHWSLAVQEVKMPSLAIDPKSGLLTFSGTEQPQRISMTLSVVDAAGTEASAALSLVISPRQALSIATTELPAFSLETAVDSLLSAQGGMPPYAWSAAGNLPEGLMLSPAGRFSGSPTAAGEYPLSVVVKDDLDNKATREFLLQIRSVLSITTDPALPPTLPGGSIFIAFGAEGGTPPYRWEWTDNAEPPLASLQLTEDGILSGAVAVESLVRLPITVRDAQDLSYSKTFLLTVSDLLIAQPSKQCVGLAWPVAAVERLLTSQGLALSEFLLSRDGKPIYQGRGSNLVDENLPTNARPTYTLQAVLADGTPLPLAEKRVSLLPFSLKKSVPGQLSDPYADEITAFQPLTAGGYGAAGLPQNVLGPPDGKNTFTPAYRPTEVLSLHASPKAGGSIELAFTDNIIALRPGEDITIFENVLFIGGDATQRFMEPAVVSVALFPGEWYPLPTDVLPPGPGHPINFRDPFYYSKGIAGRNATTGDDPTNPARSGGDSFDLDPVLAPHAIHWIRYLRIQSTGDAVIQDNIGSDPIRHPADPAFSPLSGKGASGFDLDAVSAVNY